MTFAEAMSGVTKPGKPPLSFFDQERVAMWWERELPKFFAAIPNLWLPAMPGFSQQSQGAVEDSPPAPSTKKRGATHG